MATLFNNTDADLFCAALHVMVPAHGSVEIDDDDAGKVNTASGVLRVEQAAQRAQARRGGRVAEVSGPPVMETR